MQAHVVRGIRSGIWASADATYFTGGRTTINGKVNNDLQENWRLGGTLAFPIGRRNSIKLYASSGVSATDREQLRPVRRGVAVPLGRGALMGSGRVGGNDSVAFRSGAHHTRRLHDD